MYGLISYSTRKCAASDSRSSVFTAQTSLSADCKRHPCVTTAEPVPPIRRTTHGACFKCFTASPDQRRWSWRLAAGLTNFAGPLGAASRHLDAHRDHGLVTASQRGERDGDG